MDLAHQFVYRIDIVIYAPCLKMLR